MVLPIATTTAGDAYSQLRLLGQQARDRTMQLQVQVQSGNVDSSFLLDVLRMAVTVNIDASGLVTTPGLPAYISSQLGTTVDLSGQMNSLLATLQTLRDSIVAEFPKDANGRLLHLSFDANSQVVANPIPAAQLPNTTSAMNAFITLLNS